MVKEVSVELKRRGLMPFSDEDLGEVITGFFSFLPLSSLTCAAWDQDEEERQSRKKKRLMLGVEALDARPPGLDHNHKPDHCNNRAEPATLRPSPGSSSGWSDYCRHSSHFCPRQL